MEWLYDELLSIFLEKGIGIFKKFQLKRKIKRTSENIRESVCKKYESEKYFLHLDGYIHTNRFVNNFLSNCLSSDAIWNDESIRAYCQKRLDIFFKEYPEHSVDEKSIYDCLDFIVKTVLHQIFEIEDMEIVTAVNSIKKHLDVSFDDLKSSITAIQEKTDLLEDKFESIVFKDIKHNVEYIPIITNIAFTPPELNDKFICDRNDYISDIIKKLDSCGWYHIVGSVWSGKTYVSLLLKKQCTNSVWLDLSIGKSLNTISILEKEVLNPAINGLDNKIVIIDNFPKLLISDSYSKRLITLINKMIDLSIKIVSFGCYENNDFISYLNVKDYFSCHIKDFSDDDTLKLMSAFDAPTYLLQSKTSGFIKELCGKKPAAIIIILNYLKSDNWNLSSEVLTRLLKLDIDELNNQIDYILHKTIQDSETRDLLYRIAYVGFEVKKEDIDKIANIEPKISLVGERLNEMKGVWLTEDNAVLVNGLLKNAAHENLSTDMKKNIGSIIADSILVNKELNQIDIIRLVGNLITAERFEEAGQVYMIAMQSLCSDHIEYNDSLLFVKMWNETHLPKEMSNFSKAGIRLYQIFYDAQNGRKNTFAIDELNSISKENSQIKELIVLASGMIIMDSFDIALSLLETVDFVSIRTYFDAELFVGLIVMSMYKCTCVSDIDRWFKWIKKQVDDKWLSQIDDYEYTDFFIHAFDMVRDKINCEEIELMETLIDEMDYFAIEHSWKSLHIGCLIKIIHLNGINRHDYETAKKIYSKQLEENTEPIALAHLCYKMGLLASDNKDYIFAEECYNKSTSTLAYLGDFDKVFCLVNCAITYFHNMKYDIAKIVIDQAFEKANSYTKNVFTEELLFKLHFERVIAYYTSGDMFDAINSIDYICHYFINNGINDNEHLIVISLHCLVYIAEDLIEHDPPKVLNENEEYTAPYMGLLWNVCNSNKFHLSDIDLRYNSLLYLLALIFDYYGYNVKANDCVKYLRDKNNYTMITSQITIMAIHRAYYIYKLWEIGEYSYASYLLAKVIEELEVRKNQNRVRYILLKCSFHLLQHYEIINSVLISFKNNDILSANPYIQNFITAFELLNQNGNDENIIILANAKATNNEYLKAVCYVIATEKADLNNLIELYLCILYSVGDIVLNDIYWMNDVLIPLIKRQLSSYIQEKSDMDNIINGHNSIFNGYKYKVEDLKDILKKCIVFVDESKINREWLKWLY
ncbi:hypothetical protein SAMN02910265_02418 [Ruminococcus flavefaciens]|uniref:Tetratricopeptide repeat-containing protein n=1 Tax=Ruminococcus flavefaciens TaxID=1265 RepID=A0A1H6KG93_RUMFL|nr:hypothetical protein [Ruminococcus flavefaciens]SEH74175.1 hypothetical protein SAMN02910265_02418 [Ruminococcus flavefaciens]